MNRKSELHNYILTYKDYDSDYWTSGNGNNEILFMLEKYSPNSWRNLEEELESWNVSELEILAGALSDEESWIYAEDISKILPQRSSLFACIFAKIDVIYAIDLLDRFEFIFKGSKKSYSELSKIKIKFENITNQEGFRMFYSEERINFLKKTLDQHINTDR